jgi:hypothetical protein
MTPETLVAAALGAFAIGATNAVCWRSLKRPLPMDEHTRVVALKIAAIRTKAQEIGKLEHLHEIEDWRRDIIAELGKVQEQLSPSREQQP